MQQKTGSSPSEDLERSKIKTRLLQAGFQVQEKKGLLLINCPRYTVTAYFSNEFQQWRLTPYDDQAQRLVREALENA